MKGEEIGMADNYDITWEQTEDPQACQSNRSIYMQYSRDPVRTPMQWDDTNQGGFCASCNETWLPVHENYRDVNVKKQIDDPNSTLSLYKNLIQLRKDKDVLKFGGISTGVLDDDDQVFAFERTVKDHPTIAFVMNLGGEKTIDLRNLFKEGDVSSKTIATVLIANNKSKFKKDDVVKDLKSITLGEYDAVVFEMSSAMRLATSALYAVAAFWIALKIFF